MPTIYIDNEPYEVKDGQNLLEAALNLGFDLPYFCWHPAMGSVGACRQCAVIQYKDESDTKGKLVMACMTDASDGTRISIADTEANQFRKDVIEWLMLNHPHDCPVCDEGGECHLQDMTVMTGHNYRRTRFRKRTHRNQNLGPFINHEMNRCITCYRCVRFYRDYAGGDDLREFAAHDHVYFGRYEEGPLENEFSGNLVEVCPTGVFTDKTLKQHYARKWDLQSAPSICRHCSLGCNTLLGTRYNSVVRTLNRFSHQVNGYFLCDRGRFGYEYINSGHRIRKPFLRSISGSPKSEVSRKEAVERMAELTSDPSKVIGIGSPRASLESNFALRTLVGADRFFCGVSRSELDHVNLILDILRNGPARSASLRDAEKADAVLVLGEDVTNTAPMLALSLRQASRNKPMQHAHKAKIPTWNDSAVRIYTQGSVGPVFIATSAETKLSDAAADTYRATPDDVARFGFAVAHAISPDAPAVSDLSGGVTELVNTVAESLNEAERPLIVSGTSMNSRAVIEAAANVSWALCRMGKRADICYTLPNANSLGLAHFGAGALDDAIETAKSGNIETVVVLESDLLRTCQANVVDELLANVKHVVVLDSLETTTTSRAELTIPVATSAEGDGTLVNNEGRAQRYFQALNPDEFVRDSWKWIRDVMKENRREEAERWGTFDGVANHLFSAIQAFGKDIKVAPDGDFRRNGQKVARSTFRYSGRTAITANQNVSEPKPPDDPDTPLAYSMEGIQKDFPGSLIPFFWAPGWNSVQSTNKYQQEIGGSFRGGDPGVRLIEPNAEAAPSFFDRIPSAFKAREGEWLVVPLYHIFGSEELSAQGKAISERTPEPYVALNAAEAAKMQLDDGEAITLLVGDTQYSLRLELRSGLPTGVAGLPMGLLGPSFPDLPAWGTIAKA